ncbi:MAG: S-methyl-5-thioribose-1-phosphate isomerase [Thermoanaerobacterales bacterium]|nr:S-methyl-5-thioribose-1-phosphate isomerase [Thermoanaerobacterales bacterium]
MKERSLVMDVLRWENRQLLLLDQTLLPHRTEYLTCTHYRDVAEAISLLRVRGAPAIGVAAAYGYALAAFNYQEDRGGSLEDYLKKATRELGDTRSTAVNLRWALEQMDRAYRTVKDKPLDEVREHLLEAARGIHMDELRLEKRIADFGSSLIPKRARILTYCNTGALATAGWGTALGIVRTAHDQGKDIEVYVSETRPVLQGARLTAWELQQAGIPYKLITDNMAGYLFRQNEVDLVLLGADRIAANGDFANKIGTYNLAVLANFHDCPFYVAAPSSTIDLKIDTGEEIPIEMRDPQEVRTVRGHLITIEGCPVLNPSFDVTPHQLVSAFITEKGVIKPPYDLVKIFAEEGADR